jgi:hypothetical protein
MYVTHNHVESDRLGNQLFRLATSLSYSITHNKILTFKDWRYKEYFNLSFDSNYDGGFENTYHEKRFEFDPIPYFEGNLSLSGYYQSEKYFIENAKEIRSAFRCVVGSKKSCAVHVRRGDYLAWPNIFFTCDMLYYQKTMEKVKELWGINEFVIYSDDLAWCMQNFNSLSNIYRIEYSTNTNYITDFIDLQNHYANIISNSTFSWWGAWLSGHDRVVGPKQWFQPTYSVSSVDIIPERWIQI